jgi:hypothetical protein
MDNSELITELLQALIEDVKAIKKEVKRPPTESPVDYGPRLEALTKAVEALPDRLKQAPASPDQSAIMAQLDRIEHNSRQHPDYKASQYVQIGAYASGLLVVLLVIATGLAFSWRHERDEYVQAHSHDNWRVRYTKQANPKYYSFMEGKFTKDPTIHQWVAEQEQADQKRDLARKAAEQAKALTKQANRLGGEQSQPEP